MICYTCWFLLLATDPIWMWHYVTNCNATVTHGKGGKWMEMAGMLGMRAWAANGTNGRLTYICIIGILTSQHFCYFTQIAQAGREDDGMSNLVYIPVWQKPNCLWYSSCMDRHCCEIMSFAFLEAVFFFWAAQRHFQPEMRFHICSTITAFLQVHCITLCEVCESNKNTVSIKEKSECVTDDWWKYE